MRSSANPPSRTKKKRIESIIDRPIRPNLSVKDGKLFSANLLPEPLKPTPYIPPKPVPKPHAKLIIKPKSLLRKKLPKKVTEKVKTIQKLIDEIAPYLYS